MHPELVYSVLPELLVPQVLPVQALLVELGLYDLMRGKATIVVVLWSVLLAAVTLAVLNLSPVQRACDAVANCWYKRK